ncbi:hypothetical protein Taro_005089, partial [Colocasia esculenta]|nr:hypothetical protein [Colocasia esculenta]
GQDSWTPGGCRLGQLHPSDSGAHNRNRWFIPHEVANLQILRQLPFPALAEKIGRTGERGELGEVASSVPREFHTSISDSDGLRIVVGCRCCVYIPDTYISWIDGVIESHEHLYGIRVRPTAPVGSASSKGFADSALIHHSLPDELLFEIFSRMPPYSLGRAACVCRKWRYTVRNPTLWRAACLKAWQASGASENCRIVQSLYEGSWRKMFLQRPRVRTDEIPYNPLMMQISFVTSGPFIMSLGLYASRNTYIRTGIREWNTTNPVHVVCYYRYIRFFPSGKFLYKIDGAILYPGLRPTLLRMRLRLRGTTLGANNRLDLLTLITTGVNETELSHHDNDMLGAVEGWQENETHDPDVPAVSHRRGMAPFVFVSFEEVESSVLNLPVEKMDYFVPG